MSELMLLACVPAELLPYYVINGFIVAMSHGSSVTKNTP